MNKLLLLCSILFILGLGFYYRIHPLSSKVRIGNTVIVVEIAATESQKQLGLGGRDTLAEGKGMLFPYDHKEQYNFWMRGMRFPLDFIWIDGNRIVDITENVPPPHSTGAPIVVKPSVDVNKVLEVNAGMVRRTGIKVGDTIEFIDR